MWRYSLERAEQSQKRIAFVVGNGTYADGALPTAANDAGLIAQTLQAAGFEVVGARDLDAETLRQSYADFLKKVSDAGPDTVAFVYLAATACNTALPITTCRSAPMFRATPTFRSRRSASRTSPGR